MTAKQNVLETVQRLPDDATLAEILAELQALRAPEREERETDPTMLLKWFP